MSELGSRIQKCKMKMKNAKWKMESTLDCPARWCVLSDISNANANAYYIRRKNKKKWSHNSGVSIAAY